jgi:hypothetical protein
MLKMIDDPAMAPEQILIKSSQLVVRNSTVPWTRS